MPTFSPEQLHEIFRYENGMMYIQSFHWKDMSSYLLSDQKNPAYNTLVNFLMIELLVWQSTGVVTIEEFMETAKSNFMGYLNKTENRLLMPEVIRFVMLKLFGEGIKQDLEKCLQDKFPVQEH
jgi:steroid 5-alpha reductase family enzyme